MRTITRTEWKAKHRDSKLVRRTPEGLRRWVLALDAETGATVLEPVTLIPDPKPEG